jgi:hypothetical protein
MRRQSTVPSTTHRAANFSRGTFHSLHRDRATSRDLIWQLE